MGIWSSAVVSEYRAWQQMKQRCSNPRNKSFRYYGGKGIQVCVRWRKFANFIKDMGPKPSPAHTLERIKDVDYRPENCRWALRVEQNRNKSDTRKISYRGETRCLAEWCRVLGISYNMAKKRLKRGWSALRTLTAPARDNGFGGAL